MTLDLLIEQIPDPVHRENYRRIQRELEQLAATIASGSTTVTINNPVIDDDDVWEKFDTTINSSSTKVVDLVPLANFSSVKYILSINSAPNNLTKYYEMSIINKGTSLQDKVQRLGSGISLAVNANLVGSNLELSITNNEAYNVNLFAAKLLL